MPAGTGGCPAGFKGLDSGSRTDRGRVHPERRNVLFPEIPFPDPAFIGLLVTMSGGMFYSLMPDSLSLR